MAETLKTLAQLAPSATTLTALYTTPGATSVAVSTLAICNRGATATTFRISVAVAGAADDPKQYLAYDVQLAGNDLFVLTIGLTLAATDVVRVYAGNGSLSFALFGAEIT